MRRRDALTAAQAAADDFGFGARPADEGMSGQSASPASPGAGRGASFDQRDGSPTYSPWGNGSEWDRESTSSGEETYPARMECRVRYRDARIPQAVAGGRLGPTLATQRMPPPGQLPPARGPLQSTPANRSSL